MGFQPEWVGIALVDKDGKMAVYQMHRPQGHIEIEYHWEHQGMFWDNFTRVPRLESRVMNVNLTGELGTWDGKTYWQPPPRELPGPRMIEGVAEDPPLPIE